MNRMAIKKLLAGLTAAALTLTLAGCGGVARTAARDADTSLQKVLDAGQLVIGLDAGYPPIGYTDESGEIVGFDIDVAQEVCRRLGISLVKHPIAWADKEDALNSGEIDCIWNGMSITPARAEVMTLSEPYIRNELIFVVREDSPAQLPRDLKGMTVGVQRASTTQDAIEAAELYPDITVVTFDGTTTLFQGLQQGEVDAALMDSLAAYYFLFSGEEHYYVLDGSMGSEECAVGFRKGDQALRDKVQEFLGEMKADGTLGEISRKWFGSDITIVS